MEVLDVQVLVDDTGITKSNIVIAVIAAVEISTMGHSPSDSVRVAVLMMIHRLTAYCIP